MYLTVKLFAYFREGRFKRRDLELPDGATVAEIIRFLDIDIKEVGVTMINSRHCALDQVPDAGDQLAIFPAIGGG